MGEFRPSRPGERRGGRKKGTPNKHTTDLRKAILMAAEAAGNEVRENGGTAAYLQQQAKENPGPFMTLMGKVLPTQVQGDPENPLVAEIHRIVVNGSGDTDR